MLVMVSAAVSVGSGIDVAEAEVTEWLFAVAVIEVKDVPVVQVALDVQKKDVFACLAEVELVAESSEASMFVVDPA